ncbi:hypothetical protein ACOSQ2_005147 [Xanthoceras sorbifolium]
MEGNKSNNRFEFTSQPKDVVMIEEQEVRVNADLQAEHGLSSLKRAREDLGVEDRGKTHSMNFKSTLLSMSSP